MTRKMTLVRKARCGGHLDARHSRAKKATRFYNSHLKLIRISPTRAVLIKVKPSDTTPVFDVLQQ
jgi:hypothetical protein